MNAIATSTSTESTVNVTYVDGTELYQRYPGQTAPQDAQVVLDCRTRKLYARTNPEIGNAITFDQHHGHVQTWGIEALRPGAANCLLDDIAPLAAKICDGYESEWDGNNHVARFTDDAKTAIEEIESLCDDTDDDEGSQIQVWQASDWLSGIGDLRRQAAEVGITATTTDAELVEIEKKLVEEARDEECIDVLEGIEKCLEALRTYAKEAETMILPCPRFVRTDRGDGASEILTVVQITGRDGYFVEVCAGPDDGDDFVGLYDLDGDHMDQGNCEWEPVSTAPASVLEAVESGWASSQNVVTRLGAPVVQSETPLRDALQAAIAASLAASKAYEDCECTDQPCVHCHDDIRADKVRDDARAALAASDEPREYTIRDDGGVEYSVVTSSMVEAREEARDWVEGGDWDTDDGSVYVDVTIRGEDGTEDSLTVTLHQEEPDCLDGEKHDWDNPHSVLGGLKENPGVLGHGGGVICTECCMRCGCERMTDTWAQRSDTGEQGLEEITYDEEHYCDDEEWQSLHEEKYPTPQETRPFRLEELETLGRDAVVELEIEGEPMAVAEEVLAGAESLSDPESVRRVREDGDLEIVAEAILEARAAEQVEVALVQCECGAATGMPCSWSGPESETVTLEYMPRHLRASHEAAGNSGRYPANGAWHLRCERSCADRLVESEGQWARIV